MIVKNNYTIQGRDITPRSYRGTHEESVVDKVRQNIDWGIDTLIEYGLLNCNTPEDEQRVIKAIIELKNMRNDFDTLLLKGMPDGALMYYDDEASDIEFCIVGPLITELESK